MKKILIFCTIFLLALSLGISLGACKSTTDNSNGGNKIMENKKILVAYFSWGGNTKSIAEKIHTEAGGDIFQIEPKTPYPTDYNETAYGIAKEQKEKGIHPEITNKDVTPYDIIFVGTPAWWYTMAPPVMTFLENNNFEGKTIVPFITHGGGGKYTIADDMKNLAKGSNVLNPFAVYERGNSNTDKELQTWLKDLKF